MQAPDKKGIVKYSVILTSDSYIGLSIQQELKVSYQLLANLCRKCILLSLDNPNISETPD